MTTLIITDIRKSGCDGRFDLITAVVSDAESFEEGGLLDEAKKRCNGMLVLESATAMEEISAVNVHEGDQFMRIWARSNHGLAVGEKITLDGQKVVANVLMGSDERTPACSHPAKDPPGFLWHWTLCAAIS